MRGRVSFRERGQFHDIVRTFQKRRKQLHETGSNRFCTQTRLEKRAVIISSKLSVVTIFFLHVLLGLGSVFVLGFTTDDKIRFTNPNP